MKFRNILIMTMFTSLWAGVCSAQPGDDENSARERLIRRFEEEAPKVGEALPDITVLDAEGKTFRLTDLKGSYTILVFGCLT